MLQLKEDGNGACNRLVRKGEKVLLADCDPQASLTISLGYPLPYRLPCTLFTLMGRVMMDKPISPAEALLHHEEGIALVPASIELSGMEASLVNAMNLKRMIKCIGGRSTASAFCCNDG